MGFGSKQILASRVIDGGDNFLNSIDPAKLTEVEEEVSDYIFQRTGIIPPEDPTTAQPILRGLWADIVLFKIIKWQKNLNEEEVKRRTILKDDAEKTLDNIASGKFAVKSQSETETQEASPFIIKGTKRIITP